MGKGRVRYDKAFRPKATKRTLREDERNGRREERTVNRISTMEEDSGGIEAAEYLPGSDRFVDMAEGKIPSTFHSVEADDIRWELPISLRKDGLVRDDGDDADDDDDADGDGIVLIPLTTKRKPRVLWKSKLIGVIILAGLLAAAALSYVFYQSSLLESHDKDSDAIGTDIDSGNDSNDNENENGDSHNGHDDDNHQDGHVDENHDDLNLDDEGNNIADNSDYPTSSPLPPISSWLDYLPIIDDTLHRDTDNTQGVNQTCASDLGLSLEQLYADTTNTIKSLCRPLLQHEQCSCSSPLVPLRGVPTQTMYHQRWEKVLAHNKALIAERNNSTRVVFIGDSITEHWQGTDLGFSWPFGGPELKIIFDGLFPDALPLGVGGDRVSTVNTAPFWFVRFDSIQRRKNCVLSNHAML